MKGLRHILGFLLACVFGTVLPITATVYDSLYRRSHGAHDPSWSLSYNALFVGLGSAFVGTIAGGLGVWLLHSAHRFRFRDYAGAGATIGATCGALFTAMFNMRSDPPSILVYFYHASRSFDGTGLRLLLVREHQGTAMIRVTVSVTSDKKERGWLY